MAVGTPHCFQRPFQRPLPLKEKEMQMRAKADPHLLVRPTRPHLGAAGLPSPTFIPLRISGEAWATYRLSLHFLKAVPLGTFPCARWSFSVLFCQKGKAFLSVLLPAKCLSSTGKNGVGFTFLSMPLVRHLDF